MEQIFLKNVRNWSRKWRTVCALFLHRICYTTRIYPCARFCRGKKKRKREKQMFHFLTSLCSCHFKSLSNSELYIRNPNWTALFLKRMRLRQSKKSAGTTTKHERFSNVNETIRPNISGKFYRYFCGKSSEPNGAHVFQLSWSNATLSVLCRQIYQCRPLFISFPFNRVLPLSKNENILNMIFSSMSDCVVSWLSISIFITNRHECNISFFSHEWFKFQTRHIYIYVVFLVLSS